MVSDYTTQPSYILFIYALTSTTVTGRANCLRNYWEVVPCGWLFWRWKGFADTIFFILLFWDQSQTFKNCEILKLQIPPNSQVQPNTPLTQKTNLFSTLQRVKITVFYNKHLTPKCGTLRIMVSTTTTTTTIMWRAKIMPINGVVLSTPYSPMRLRMKKKKRNN